MRRPSPETTAATALAARYRAVRDATTRLAAPLSAEDCQIQSMPDASPTKWHLAHTTWFFETFVLEPSAAGYRAFDRRFRVLFNSYYNAVGKQHARPQRGLLSRPSLDEVRAYRAHVDAAVQDLLERDAVDAALAAAVELGLEHEQQHQELILTDIKHVLATNPLGPAYRTALPAAAADTPAPLRWHAHDEAIVEIGHAGGGFAFDNETPRHRVLVPAGALASRLVTCGEYLEFMRDGGYARPELWLSEGWDAVRAGGWSAPLYWEQRDGTWCAATLAGERPLGAAVPVCHVSFWEADAFARWAGARLPTEFEWERAATGVEIDGNFVEQGALHPLPAAPGAGPGPAQMFGDVWEWTASPFVGYPGYRPTAGALGEYNGKFMANQWVLRGGSCATPRAHVRATYRNFFPAPARWQFSGIRLARDAGR
jgi:ergothioneine biosynthesis protein EgtB